MQRVTPLAIALIMIGCGPNETPDPDAAAPEDEIENVKPHLLDLSMFKSELRPDKSDWVEGEVFTDILEYQMFNDDYDYQFIGLGTDQGQAITMHVLEQMSGSFDRNHEVKWRVSKYNEAGEGEAYYYKEEAVAMTALRSSYSFEAYWNRFIQVYPTLTIEDIVRWQHELAPVQTLGEMGVYCILSKNDSLRSQNLPTHVDVYNTPLSGDMCSENQDKDGYYYEFIEAEDLPGYAEMAGEPVFHQLKVYEEVGARTFVRVRVIQNSFFERDLYFFNNGDGWYFWIENFCGCSA